MSGCASYAANFTVFQQAFADKYIADVQKVAQRAVEFAL